MDLSRRSFLKQSALFVVLGVPAPGAFKTEVNPSDLKEGLIRSHADALGQRDPHSSASRLQKSKKVLVLVQLRGGNDALSMVVPYTSSAYYAQRGELAVPAQDVLAISNQLGFNPAMTGLHSLYKSGCVAVLPSVGYANESRSHFRATDIWHSAIPGELTNTGWAARLLEWQRRMNPEMATSECVAACSVERERPLLLMHPKLPAHAVETLAPRSPETELPFAYGSRGEIHRHFDQVLSSLRIGCPAQIYSISIDGFDTHAHQDRILPQLYRELSSALVDFHTELEKNCPMHDVVTLVYSEFGRRLIPNDCRGTDHGGVGASMLLGNSIRGGIFGSIAADSLSTTSPIADVDFREIYATILDAWLDADSAEILNGRFQNLRFIGS